MADLPLSPSAPAASAPASRHAVTFILITVFLDMIGFGIIIPVLPKLIQSVGEVSLGQAAVIGGWMAAAYSIAQFFFAPLMGNLSDRFGRRPLLLLAILGLGLDFLLHALAPTLAWLFVGRLLAGLCGASWIIANAFIADVTAPEERAKAYGMMGAAFGMGFVIGPAVGGLLGEFGPRVPFYAAAGISMLNLIYGYFVLPESLPADKRRPFELRRANPFGAFAIFRSYSGVIPMCVVMFSFFFFSSVYPAIWPFWAFARFGWSEAMVGLTLAIFGVIMAAFQGLGTGPAVKWLGEFRVVLLGLVCATIAATGYGLAGGAERGRGADGDPWARGVHPPDPDRDHDQARARECAGRVAGRHLGGDERRDAGRNGVLLASLWLFHVARGAVPVAQLCLFRGRGRAGADGGAVPVACRP
ncbi:MAG: MFS transporter [Paracoccaceae bacterium]